MKIMQCLFLAACMTVVAGWNPAVAMEGGHGDMKDHSTGMSSMQHEEYFLEKKTIDGFMVHFHVMKVEPGVEAQGSHNFMVKVEKDDQVLGDLVINSKVIDPAGKVDSKYLMKMGDWYMNGYNFHEKGQYQLLILFKTADGVKHKGGIAYEAK